MIEVSPPAGAEQVAAGQPMVQEVLLTWLAEGWDELLFADSEVGWPS